MVIKMNKLIGSWSFYKKTLLIAVPIMVQNLITNFVAMIDNIMVGQIGTEQMSGVAIVNQLFFVLNLTIFGAISGASIFCAQFYGKGDNKGIQSTFRFKLLTVFVVVAVGIGIFMLFGEPLITMYLHDAEKGIDLVKTFEFGKEYMLIMLVGLLPFALEQAYSSTLRECGYSTQPMLAGIAAVVTNTVLNLLLIFGIGIFPEMGVSGAAIATVISRFVQLGIVVAWTHLNTAKLEFVKGLYKTMRVPSELVKRILRKGVIPLTMNECLWSAGVAMLAQCYSLRGIDVVAGMNISNTVVNLFNVMYIAFASGASVVIGQMLGANKLEEAKESAPKLIFFAGIICVVIGGVAIAFSGLFPKAYNTTEDVRYIAQMFICISAAFMPVQSILNAMYFIMRSGGKTVITFIFDCGFSWGVSVPFAFCLAHFTDIHILGVYFCCQAIEIVKCVIGIILIKKGVWLSNIVDK